MQGNAQLVYVYITFWIWSLALVFLGAMLTAGLLLWVRQRAYRRYLSYDQKQSYLHNLAGRRMQAVTVHCTADGFALPELLPEGFSAFLELTVRATIAGKVFDPFIEVEVSGLIGRQYLERGARGTRYLNLSRFLGLGMRPGDWLTLRGKHVTWEAKRCTLYLSRERLSTNDKVLVVAPHPDDAEIAAFGIYSSRPAAVVTIGAGDVAGRCLNGSWNGRNLAASTMARLRVWDSITVPFIGSVTPLSSINLAYPDGGLAELYARHLGSVPNSTLPEHDFSGLRQANLASWMPPEPLNCSWESLVSDFVHIFRHLQPTVIVTPYPWHDPHPDHGFATLAVSEALRRAELSSGRVYLYLNHYRITELHPMGPAGSMVSLPPFFEQDRMSYDTLYSHSLSEEEQRSKYFALEAMHDLRELSHVDAPKWGEIYRSLRSSVHARIHGLGLPPTSYFRRAVRPQELFFVVPFCKLQGLINKYERILVEEAGYTRN